MAKKVTKTPVKPAKPANVGKQPIVPKYVTRAKLEEQHKALEVKFADCEAYSKKVAGQFKKEKVAHGNTKATAESYGKEIKSFENITASNEQDIKTLKTELSKANIAHGLEVKKCTGINDELIGVKRNLKSSRESVALYKQDAADAKQSYRTSSTSHEALKSQVESFSELSRWKRFWMSESEVKAYFN